LLAEKLKQEKYKSRIVMTKESESTEEKDENDENDIEINNNTTNK
jgi:hypothetical protein